MLEEDAAARVRARVLDRLREVSASSAEEQRPPSPGQEAEDLNTQGDTDGQHVLLEPECAVKEQVNLPKGWREAVDAWVRAGCPKGDPVMIGLNLLDLKCLAQVPQKERPELLRDWRRQVRERMENSQ